MQEVIASLGDAAGLVLQPVDLLDEVVVVHVSLVEDEQGGVDGEASVQPIQLKLVEPVEVDVGEQEVHSL